MSDLTAKEYLNSFLSDLADAPVSEIAKTETNKIRSLIGKEPSEIMQGLENILDDCCEFSLASDFAVTMLDLAFCRAGELTAKGESDDC